MLISPDDALIGKSEMQVKEEKLPEPELKEETIPEPEVAEAHEEACSRRGYRERKNYRRSFCKESSERPVINYSFFGNRR